ncbi:MAG: Type 1 glutamine amidotransferase-like domain-containing protein [Pseudomonadota bacterium]
MKMYLSSYELGHDADRLRTMVSVNNNLGYIFNALDFTSADPDRRARRVERNLKEMREIGFECFDLDLRTYFHREDDLRALVRTLGAIWVCGGNVFVLRQAFKLSGFDKILLELNQDADFLYGGYSAGVCVLGPTLKAYQIVDDPTDRPYEGLDEVIWDGVGLLDFVFLPHFQSDHPESEAIDMELAYCKARGLPYQTTRDGEVIIFE